MEKQDIERLAKLETEIKTIREVMLKMDGKLDGWNQNFVPRPELGEMLKTKEKEIVEINQNINNIREDIVNNRNYSSNKWEQLWSKATWFLLGIMGSIYFWLIKGGT
ncbi:hypothetical protein VQL36_16500 [Chengkuizengella sp. SCS-71B]|uniref:hypothetical protein n=1 Tax=Chengkuizengella sp. SCS-71B TaxID=3115290 RepID=UPI0032C225A7